MNELITQANPDQTSPPKKNVIIYARYSSELQNDRSIEDQVAACKQALLLDEQVTHVFEDRAKSGAFMIGRPGIHSLLAEVKRGSCAIIVTEALDRLSRSLEDVAHIYRLASFYGVQIRTLLEDEITEMHICFNGAMASMQLQQTVERTRRGQIGNIHTGKAGGGLAYGYRVKHLNDEGVPEPGLREINLEQAAVVQLIYADYAAEVPVLQIVKRLNAAGIPSPRGGKWSAVTITGHYARGDGILQNALYRGLLVWGRCPETKHPVTAKRQIRIEDKDKWVTQPVSHLRIVEDDLWFKVQRIRKEKHHRLQRRRCFDPVDLDYFCARCGAELIQIERKYLSCSNFKRHQTCSNKKRYAIAELVALLFTRFSELPRSQWQSWVENYTDDYGKVTYTLDDINSQIDRENLRLERLVGALADGLSTSQKVRDHICKAEQAMEKLISARATLGQSPHPSELSWTDFQSAVTRARASGQQRQFVVDAVDKVSFDRDKVGHIVITSLKPDFTAVAGLNSEPD